MRYILPTLALMALASSCVTALGINCQGSSKCDRFINAKPTLSAADSLRREIAAHVSDSRWYQNGQQIVCIDGRGPRIISQDGSICAFLQGTGGISGKEIKTLARRIVEHGCKTCGSVPVYFDKGDNDVKTHGELTFNYVDRNTAGDGKCSSIFGNCHYE